MLIRVSRILGDFRSLGCWVKHYQNIAILRAVQPCTMPLLIGPLKSLAEKNASKVMAPPFVGALLNNVCVYVYGLTYWMVPLVSSVLLVGLAWDPAKLDDNEPRLLRSRCQMLRLLGGFDSSPFRACGVWYAHNQCVRVGENFSFKSQLRW